MFQGPRVGPSLLLSLVVAACGGNDLTVGESSLTTTAETADVDVQGHRGAAGLRPESTLPSFEVALDLGVTTLEFDIHVTADDQLVIWHDPTISPSKCGASSDMDPALDPDGAGDLMIISLTAQQLRTLSCDRNPDVESHPDQAASPGLISGSDYGIITMDELFSFVDGYVGSDQKSAQQRAAAAAVRFNIETKGRSLTAEGRLESLLVAEITARSLRDRVTIQSFDPDSLAAVRELDSGLDLVLLTTNGVPDFESMLASGVSAWSPNHRDLTAASIAAAHEHGVLVLPYTINDPSRMAVLVVQGVDGLISDRPDLALVAVDASQS